MNILVITQKMDKMDPVLGFFHSWIEEFSKQYKRVTVICLCKGEYNVPKNVKVFSLGKEKGVSRLIYLVRFYKYIWSERKNYDSVLVHMNKEYIILGKFIWLVLRKNIYLWYNHQHAGIMAKIAFLLSKNIFHTSDFAAPARFKKAIQMPVGVDSEIFKRNIHTSKINNSLLFISRVSPVKKLDVLVSAVQELIESGIECTLHIYGSAPDRDMLYFNKVKEMSRDLEECGKIIFYGAVENSQTPEVYNTYDIFVNLTDSGSFDKTIIEAMLSESLVLVSNKTLKSTLDSRFLFEEGNMTDLVSKLKGLLSLDETKIKECGLQMRKKAIKHDLDHLMQSFMRSIK